MGKWSNRTDFLSIWKLYLCFCLFLAYVAWQAKSGTLAHTNVTQSGWINNHCYFYLQFITCIIVVTITALLFEEVFKKSTSEYLKVLHIGCLKSIVWRYCKLFCALGVVYFPTVYFVFIQANQRLLQYYKISPELVNQTATYINLWIPMVQCLIALNFYITITLFLMQLFKNKIYPMILLMAYCALEAGPMCYILGSRSMFAGAFCAPNYTVYLSDNIRYLLISTLILFPLTLLLHSGKLRFSSPKVSYGQLKNGSPG